MGEGPWGALIGAGLGVLKTELADKPRAERERWLAAATQRYSPWTHLTAQPVQEADPFGNVMQGAMGGLAQGQNIQNARAGKISPNSTVGIPQSSWDMGNQFFNAPSYSEASAQVAPTIDFGGSYEGLKYPRTQRSWFK